MKALKMKLVNFERIEPISLDNLPPYFAIVAPYKGRDILVAYADRTKGMELYSAYISGLFSEKQDNFLFPQFSRPDDAPVNLIFSKEFYPDINDNENGKKRLSNLVFIWSGYCTEIQKVNIQKQFDSYSNEIFELVKKSYIVNDEIQKQNGEVDFHLYDIQEKITYSLEEYVAILIYPAINYSTQYKARKKNKIKNMGYLFLIYIVFTTIMLLFLYFQIKI